MKLSGLGHEVAMFHFTIFQESRVAVELPDIEIVVKTFVSVVTFDGSLGKMKLPCAADGEDTAIGYWPQDVSTWPAVQLGWVAVASDNNAPIARCQLASARPTCNWAERRSCQAQTMGKREIRRSPGRLAVTGRNSESRSGGIPVYLPEPLYWQARQK